MVRAEPDGSLVVAGSAKPGAEVQVFADGALLGVAKAEAGGDWVLVPEKPVATGGVELTLGVAGTDRRSPQSFVVAIDPARIAEPLVVASTPGQMSTVLQGLAAPKPLTSEPAAASTTGPLAPSAGRGAASTAAAAVSPSAEAATVIKPTATPSAAAALPVTSGAPVAPGAAAAATPAQPGSPADATVASIAPVKPAPVAVEPLVGAPAAPSIDAIEIDGERNFFAGNGPDGATVRLYVDDHLVGDAVVAGGRWLVEARKVLTEHQQLVRLDVLKAGSAEVAARAEVNFVVDVPAAASPAPATIAGTAPTMVQPAAGAAPQPAVGAVAPKAVAPATPETTAVPAASGDRVASIPAESSVPASADSLKPSPTTASPANTPAAGVPAYITAPAISASAPSHSAPTSRGPVTDAATRAAAPVATAVNQPADAARAVNQPGPVAAAVNQPSPAVAAANRALVPAPTLEIPAPAAINAPAPIVGTRSVPAAVAEASPPIRKPAAAGSAPSTITNDADAAVTPSAPPPTEVAPTDPAAIPTLTAEPVGGRDSGRFASGKAIIRHGDNLWTIAERVYGSGLRYTTIYQANDDQIRNPRWIYPGQVFDLPNMPGQ